jgi:site-specific DNA-methyltransferase (adenine-specific)|nr:MAG TPA: adenine specific DNA methyltransferase [Caudoviricetes sp.]
MSTQIALNVDCMEYMRTLPDKAFDLAIVDPPYGIGEDGGKSRSKFVTQKNGNRLYVEDGHYEKTGFDIAPPRQAFFDELFRVSKAQIIWGANYLTLPRAGAIVWDKCNDGSDQSDGEIAFNSLTSRVDIFRYMWRGMMQGKSISEGTIQQGNKALNEKRIHPTQKPVALYEWLLQKYAKEDWRILDTHLGSGSSRIAAYNLGFEFVGCEIEPTYFQLQEQRFAEHTAQVRMW